MAEAGATGTGVADGRRGTAGEEATWRELRVAPILTGGTSLAVWIGGVTAELYRVVNCFDDRREGDVYRTLLELTCTKPLVDVVTGTSAGGLNGVLLSTAWACRAPTATVVGLRDLWLDLGSITSLLRSPNEKNPPSLLRGDDYFWPELAAVVSRIAAAGAGHAAAAGLPVLRRDVDLAVTVTTLSGEPTRRIDDIGQELQETRQDHRLRFGSSDFGGDDPDWAQRLGLAARTSASIPGVFEASYLPVDEPVRDRPAFGARASFSVGRWAVDGGVLANQPIGVALDRIIEQSADGEIRRVALFVNPTPSEVPPAAPDDPTDEPMLATVAASAFTAPRNIGIRHEVDDLRRYNDRVRRSVDVGRAIARVLHGLPDGGTDPLLDMASSLYDRFRHDRAVLSVASMLDRLGPELDLEGYARPALEEALIHAVRTTDTWLPGQIGEIPVGLDWQWGIAPLEYTASLLFELVRHAYRLPMWILEPEHRGELGEIRGELHRVVTRLDGIRDVDRRFWREAVARRPTNLFQWADFCYRVWPDASRLPDPGSTDDPAPESSTASRRVHSELRDIARDLSVLQLQLVRLVGGIDLDAVDESEPPEARDDARAVQDLLVLLRVERGAAEPERVRRMVALHIVAVALGGASVRPAEIELVEVSWRAPNRLDPQRSPADKLAGTEFSRLGAFVKRSWRANDWMWGRMDGAAQLVRLLLDPQRLRQLGVLPDVVIAALRELHPDELAPERLRAIEMELGFLLPGAHGEMPAPRSLPCTTDAFVEVVQLGIAREELPEVYLAVRRSVAEGGGEGDGGDFCREFGHAIAATPVSALSDKDIVRLFTRCRIGAETAASEVGNDLLTRTAGEAGLVLANALTGERSGLRWPSRVSRPFRQMAMVTYALTRAATTTSRTGMAVSAVLTAVAGAILAMFLLADESATRINAGLVLLAVLILALGLFVAILRSGILAALPAFLALLVVALALMGDDMASIVTGTLDRDPAAGWRHTVFLGSWPLVTIVLIAASIGWVVSAGSRARSRWRLHRIDRLQATMRGVPRPVMDPGWLREPVIVAVVVPALLLLHQPLLRQLMVGEDSGWRAWLIDASQWLGDRSVVVVVAGLAAFGVFFGLAWDRTIGRALQVAGRGVRRVLGALRRAARRTSRPAQPVFEAAPGCGGADEPDAPPVLRTLVPHPLEAVDGWRRRVLLACSAVVTVTALVVLRLASNRLGEVGESYDRLQTSAGDLGAALSALQSVQSWVLTAVVADLVFAAAYGIAAAALVGWFAERAAARGWSGLQIGLSVSAWLWVLAAVADLAENTTLGAALWRFDQGDTALDAVGWLAAGLGAVKWGAIVAAVVVPVAGWVLGAVLHRRRATRASEA